MDSPSPLIPPDVPAAPPAPVPWSPSRGRLPAPPNLTLDDTAGSEQQAPTPEQRRLQIQKHQRRSTAQLLLRRAVSAILLTLAIGAGTLWATRQPWWSPALLGHLPQPAPIAGWLRQPSLAVLPGLATEWNPWAPLTLSEPESLLTRWKIGRLESDRPACEAWLTSVPSSELAPLPDYTDSSTLLCGWKAASHISRLDGVRFTSPFTLSCGAAVALARWERHALQPAARTHLGTEVTRIEHLGSYACRTIGSRAEGELSSHANAQALDIAGFTLADGRHIRVGSDWHSAETAASKKATAQAAFLREALGGACSSFNAVLGPEYDAAHHDHFHLDRGANRVCR